MRRNTSRIAAAALLVVVAAAPAAAQGTDNAGPGAASLVGGFFVSGTSPVPVNAQAAAAISQAMSTVSQTATSGNLTSPATGQTIPASTGQTIVSLMTAASQEVRAQVRTALSASGVTGAVIDQLMGFMPSLLSNPLPGQTQSAISAFNGLINNANAGFLANPPVELLAIHAVLVQIANAGNAAPQ